MQFSPRFLDEIRNRLSAAEIIGRRVKLRPKGRGEFLGLCPFHGEKTPSFTVSDNKGFYHCFGCGVHGDIIKFTMENQGLGFVETVTSLAGEAGLQLPKQDPQAQMRERKAASLYEVTEAATQYFESQLQNPSNRHALQYLKQRGIPDSIIKIFRLGFAPNSMDSLKKAMSALHINEQQLIETGLLIPSDRGQPYDRFRNRIIFPICDVKNRAIAFGGRIIGDGQPKYLNSPETQLFHKSDVLYSMNLARDTAYKKGNIVAVEGYMDVIALYTAGIKNAVAPLGTAITDDHIKLLWKCAKEPVICLDGDNAGKRAMRRCAENSMKILTPGHSLKFAILPKGEDPDDVIKSRGKDVMREILGKATALSEALWEMEINEKPTDTPEQKADFEDRIIKLVENIKDPNVRNYYKNFYNEKLWGLKRKNKKNPAKSKAINISSTLTPKSPRERYETVLLLAILNHPPLLNNHEIEEHFLHIDFKNSQYSNLRELIIDFSHNIPEEREISAENLRENLEKNGMTPYIKQLERKTIIDNFAKKDSDISLAKIGFDYIYACLSLNLMEEEYKNSVATMSENSPETVWELKKELDLLKKVAETKKMSYEAFLDY